MCVYTIRLYSGFFSFWFSRLESERFDKQFLIFQANIVLRYLFSVRYIRNQMNRINKKRGGHTYVLSETIKVYIYIHRKYKRKFKNKKNGQLERKKNKRIICIYIFCVRPPRKRVPCLKSEDSDCKRSLCVNSQRKGIKIFEIDKSSNLCCNVSLLLFYIYVP